MITDSGKAICDREVGSPQNGWHACRRPAQHKTQSGAVSYMTMHWCGAHVDRNKCQCDECRPSMFALANRRANPDSCSVCNFAPSDDCPRDHCPNRDDTPWCHICGAMQKAKCQCPPRAEND